jgi:hypothetical protein
VASVSPRPVDTQEKSNDWLWVGVGCAQSTTPTEPAVALSPNTITTAKGEENKDTRSSSAFGSRFSNSIAWLASWLATEKHTWRSMTQAAQLLNFSMIMMVAEKRTSCFHSLVCRWKAVGIRTSGSVGSNCMAERHCALAPVAWLWCLRAVEVGGRKDEPEGSLVGDDA